VAGVPPTTASKCAADTAGSTAQSRLALFKQRRREFERRLTLAAEHPCDFLLARFAVDFMEIGKGTAARYVLTHDEMRRSRRGDLRQMCDADHLMIAPQFLHLCSNRMRDFATHVRVDLIEHKQWDGIVHS